MDDTSGGWTWTQNRSFRSFPDERLPVEIFLISSTNVAISFGDTLKNTTDPNRKTATNLAVSVAVWPVLLGGSWATTLSRSLIFRTPLVAKTLEITFDRSIDRATWIAITGYDPYSFPGLTKGDIGEVLPKISRCWRLWFRWDSPPFKIESTKIRFVFGLSLLEPAEWRKFWKGLRRTVGSINVKTFSLPPLNDDSWLHLFLLLVSFSSLLYFTGSVALSIPRVGGSLVVEKLRNLSYSDSNPCDEIEADEKQTSLFLRPERSTLEEPYAVSRVLLPAQ